MIELIAKRTFDYAGRRLAAGERFKASTTDARVLTVTGLAAAAEAAVEAPSRRRYRRRDMQAGA